MPGPSNALQTAIYRRLTGYAPMKALATGGVFDFVPATAQPPYVKIGDDTAVDWSTMTSNGWDITLTIHSWDFEKAGRKSVKSVMSAIYDALHRQEANVIVTGFTLVMLQSEFETSFQDTSETGQPDHFYHGVQRFRALVQA
ncbi:DUF3168 domain-containing protein [Zavarzinella formosa]|uniref:DUF3168 domain-containing protein n=1 Tax=Zavarzinella formosa TaxID=360055 RepID=UPI0003131060|nr:DUF3168 domain-containing protein [Zavarzinella formosa]